MRKSRFFESFSLGEEVEHNLELCLKHESGEGYITDCINTLMFFDRFILECSNNRYTKEKGLTFSEFFEFSGDIEIGKDFTSDFIETMISLEQGYTGEYLQDLNNNIDYDYLDNCINYLFIPTYIYIGSKISYRFFNKHHIFNMMYKYYYIPMFLSTLLYFLNPGSLEFLFNSLILYPYIFYSYSFLDVNLNSELYIKGEADRTISEINSIISMGGDGRYIGKIINALNKPCFLLSRLNVMYGCEWNYRGIKFYNMTKVLYEVLLKRVVPIFFDRSFLEFLFKDKTPFVNNELSLSRNKDRYSQNNLTERILSKMLSNDVIFTRLNYMFFVNSNVSVEYSHLSYRHLFELYSNFGKVRNFLKYFFTFPKNLAFNSILENCPAILDNFQFKNEDISLHRFLKKFNALNISYERNN